MTPYRKPSGIRYANWLLTLDRQCHPRTETGKGAACALRTTHPPTHPLRLPLGGFTGIALLYSRQNGLIIAGSFAVAVLGMYGGAFFQVG